MALIFLIENNSYIIFTSLFWNFHIYAMYKHVEYLMEKNQLKVFTGMLYISYIVSLLIIFQLIVSQPTNCVIISNNDKIKKALETVDKLT